MKLKVLSGWVLWLCLISLLHVWLNVGFESLRHKTRVALGQERRELVVGFLPVT